MAKDTTDRAADDRLVSDIDTGDGLHCGNCGLDYAGLTVAGLAEICDRRPCPACRQYLAAIPAADDTTLVCGCRVQVDRSGAGHCWVDVAADDLPGTIREEIEGEVIDGDREEGEIVGSNGLRYRWS